MRDAVIRVGTASRAYRVRVGAGAVQQLDRWIAEAGADGPRFVVSSLPVWRAHGGAITAALPRAGRVLMPDGERAKTVRTVGLIHDALAQAAADRTVTVVAVGGGVVGDVAGFAAATWLRGVRLVHVPTTLLAQVDSSIGGKVGVNHPLGKNLIGAFHQPITVVADPRLLDTLPRREFRAGLYEVIKYGVIADPRLFRRLERDLDAIVRRDATAIVPVIIASCRVKARVVAADEREASLRRVLNFGHTAGHAIEAVTRYRRFRHGEAIGYGMLAAADVAVRRGTFPKADRAALSGLIARLGPLPALADLSAKALVETMRHDKKVIGGQLHVVLPTRLGATEIVNDVTEAQFRRSLRAIGTAP